MVEPAQVRKLTSAQPFAPRRGARRADVCGFAGRPRIRAGLCHANAASALRGGVKKIRMKNFDWVILFGHSKTNFDSPNGRKETKMNQKQYHSLEELPLMMNMAEVAAVLGISRAGAYKLAHNEAFPAFQIGRRIVVLREKFLNWLNGQSEEKCA